MCLHICSLNNIQTSGPQQAARPAGLLFVAPKLLFLHYEFWSDQHVITGTCLHANDTHTAESLTAASAIFNFHFCFWSSSHIDILPAVGAQIARKWRVPSSLLKELWVRVVSVKFSNSKKNGLNLHSFSLQPAPMTHALNRPGDYCDEDLKRHCETKHRNFEETFPQNSELRSTKINALKSS